MAYACGINKVIPGLQPNRACLCLSTSSSIHFVYLVCSYVCDRYMSIFPTVIMFASYSQVKLLCETRWVERHNTMREIKTLYPYLLQSLQSMIASEWDAKTVTEASGFVKYLRSSQFIATFTIAEHMLGYTKQLSVKLQGEKQLTAV